MNIYDKDVPTCTQAIRTYVFAFFSFLAVALYLSDLVKALISKCAETSMVFFSLHAHTQREITCLIFFSFLS